MTMNPSNHLNRSVSQTSTISLPRDGRGSRYTIRGNHEAPQSGLQPPEYIVQRSSPIPIPPANLTSSAHPLRNTFFSPAHQANAYENRGRRRTRAQSLASSQAHRQNPAPGRTPSSQAHTLLRECASGSNSSSDQSTASSHGSSSSGIFHFSPPGSLEGHHTHHTVAHAPGPGRFVYTPPQTNQNASQTVEKIRCRACGQNVWSNGLGVHAQVCEGRRGAGRGGTSVAFSRGHDPSEQSSDIRWQEHASALHQPWTSQSRPDFANARGSLLGEPLQRDARAANVSYVHDSPDRDVFPRARHHANSFADMSPLPSPPDYVRRPLAHLP